MIIYYDGKSGRITRATSDNQPLRRDNDVIISQREIDPADYYIALPAATLTPRPRLALPPSRVTLGQDWTLVDAPAGTAVEVDGVPVGVTEAQGPLALALPLPGTYRITLSPPWPWIEAETTVTVHAD